MSSRGLLSQMTTNSVAHKPHILTLIHSGGQNSLGATVQVLAEFRLEPPPPFPASRGCLFGRSPSLPLRDLCQGLHFLLSRL